MALVVTRPPRVLTLHALRDSPPTSGSRTRDDSGHFSPESEHNTHAHGGASDESQSVPEFVPTMADLEILQQKLRLDALEQTSVAIRKQVRKGDRLKLKMCMCSCWIITFCRQWSFEAVLKNCGMRIGRCESTCFKERHPRPHLERRKSRLKLCKQLRTTLGQRLSRPSSLQVPAPRCLRGRP